ncbi:hypothetical protein BaRGS_00018501 [Batillaria attramentaria]|uniref:Uncharacterized protein n=1 Tax=Batillaria attramentaria TaxID=370345 RepID=A0ABD0KT03_9CAEN
MEIREKLAEFQAKTGCGLAKRAHAGMCMYRRCVQEDLRGWYRRRTRGVAVPAGCWQKSPRGPVFGCLRAAFVWTEAGVQLLV